MLVRGSGGGGGRKTYYKQKTLSIVNNLCTIDDVGFQPSLVVVMTPNYIYTYNYDFASGTYVTKNQAWASGQYAGYFNSIVPNANGFVMTPAASAENGKTATIFCVKCDGYDA